MPNPPKNGFNSSHCGALNREISIASLSSVAAAKILHGSSANLLTRDFRQTDVLFKASAMESMQYCLSKIISVSVFSGGP
jgi:hypothetical protein